MAPQSMMMVTMMWLGVAVLFAAGDTGRGSVVIVAPRLTPEQRLVAALKDPKVSQFVLTSDVVLTASLPPSQKDFTLVGRCKDRRQRPRLCVVDGQGKFRGFFSEGYYVGMSDIHFKNMCDTSESSGPYDFPHGIGSVAFAFNGKIRATRCVFESNKAHTGGAFGVHDSPLLVSDCQFRNNSAVGIAGAFRVFSNGCATVKRSVFSFNSAGIEGGVARVYEGCLNFVDCKVHQNRARNGNGGAVVFGWQGFGVLSKSEFVGNSAPNGSGGAVEVEGDTAFDEVNLCGCTFNGNRAKTSGSFNVNIGSETRVTFCKDKPQGLRVPDPANAVVNCTVCAKPVYWDNKKSV